MTGPHALAGMTGDLTHVGYAVDDLAAAASWWATNLGAGPFLLLPEGGLGELTSGGAPATFDVRVAFGQWGRTAVELQLAGTVQPEPLARALGRPGGGINHVSYVADDIDDERDRLEEAGLPCLLSARGGVVELSIHAGGPLGHAVELYQRSAFVDDFFEQLRREHDAWDGSRPLRDA